MPYLLCMSLVALLSGVLNSLGKFVESSAVSIVLNLTMMAATIFAIVMGLSNEPLAGIVQAWGVFAAGILQLPCCSTACAATGWRSNCAGRA